MNVFQESIANIGPFLNLPGVGEFSIFVILSAITGGAIGTFSATLLFRETESPTDDLIKSVKYGATIGSACGAAIGAVVFLLRVQ